MICSQDQLYVQNVELARFSAQFRDVATKFAENEKTIRSLQVMGSNLYEVSWRPVAWLLLATGGHLPLTVIISLVMTNAMPWGRFLPELMFPSPDTI